MKKIVLAAILLVCSSASGFAQTTDKVQAVDSLRLLPWKQVWQKKAINGTLQYRLDSILSFKRNNSNLPVYDDLNWLTQQKRLFAARSSHDKMPCAVPKGKYAMRIHKPDNSVRYQMLVLPVN